MNPQCLEITINSITENVPALQLPHHPPGQLLITLVYINSSENLNIVINRRFYLRDYYIVVYKRELLFAVLRYQPYIF